MTLCPRCSSAAAGSTDKWRKCTITRRGDRCCRKSTRGRRQQVGGHPGEWTLRRSFCLNRLAQLYGLKVVIFDASGTTVTLVVTDAEGCMAQSATALSVHSAPAPVNVMFSELDSAICSGGSITLTMDDPVLDGSSTLDDFSYIWTAMGSNNEVYTVDQLSPFVDEAGDLTLATSQGWSSDFDPVTVSFELDMTDGVCASTFSFPDQISLYPSPRITVPNNLDYRMCEGFDWTGPISGASSLEYVSPYTGELIEMSSSTGTIDWVMPWSEAEAAMQAGDPTVFELLAISDFGGAVCTDTWTLTLDVVGNPMINPNNPNVPAEICVGQSVTISSGIVQGSGNGQPLSFVWSNAGDDPIFNVNPIQTGASAGISVNTDIPVPASGDVTFTLTDGAGCQADTTLSVVIHELPTFGALNATPDVVCSGEEIQLTFVGIDVDDNLDVADATYTWSASVDGSNVAVNGDDFSLNVTPAIGAAVAALARRAHRERLARAVREKGRDNVEGAAEDDLCVICLAAPVDPVEVGRNIQQ